MSTATPPIHHSRTDARPAAAIGPASPESSRCPPADRAQPGEVLVQREQRRGPARRDQDPAAAARDVEHAVARGEQAGEQQVGLDRHGRLVAVPAPHLGGRAPAARGGRHRRSGRARAARPGSPPTTRRITECSSARPSRSWRPGDARLHDPRARARLARLAVHGPSAPGPARAGGAGAPRACSSGRAHHGLPELAGTLGRRGHRVEQRAAHRTLLERAQTGGGRAARVRSPRHAAPRDLRRCRRAARPHRGSSGARACVATSRGSPLSTPPSMSASASRNTYAGPEPESPVTASSIFSGTRTTMPDRAQQPLGELEIRLGRACVPAAIADAPRRTTAGVFGMARITGRPGAAASSSAIVMPAAIESTSASLAERRRPPLRARRRRAGASTRRSRRPHRGPPTRGSARPGCPGAASSIDAATVGIDLGDGDRRRARIRHRAGRRRGLRPCAHHRATRCESR